MAKDFSLIPEKVMELVENGKIAMAKKGHCNLFPLIPDIDTIQDFIEGDLGIADTILKNLLATLMAPIGDIPNVTKEETFAAFQNNAMIPFTLKGGVDFNNLTPKEHDEDSGPKPAPGIPDFKDLIDITPQGVGLHPIERVIFKSMFETQKPYFDVAKVVIEILCDIEDIAARALTITGGKYNAPIGYTDRSLCHMMNKTGENSVENALAGLEALKNSPARNFEDGSGAKTSPSNPASSTAEWVVIYESYSTGAFDPSIDYEFTYIDMPTDPATPPPPDDFEIADLEPEAVVFAIFDDEGNRLKLSQLSAPDMDWVKKKYSTDFIIEPTANNDAMSGTLMKAIKKRIDNEEEDVLPFGWLSKIKAGAIQSDGTIESPLLNSGITTLLSPLKGIFKKIRSAITQKIKQKIANSTPKPDNPDEIVESVLKGLSLGDLLIQQALLSKEDQDTDGYFMRGHSKLPQDKDLKDDKRGIIEPKNILVGTENVMVDPESDYVLGIVKVNHSFEDSPSNTHLNNTNLYGNKSNYGDKTKWAAEITYQIKEILDEFDDVDTDTQADIVKIGYIIEGVNGDVASPSVGGDNKLTAKAGDGTYKLLPHGLGAIAKFIKLLIRVATKTVPKIKEILKIFSDPFEFLINIATEKLSEEVDFFRKNDKDEFILIATLLEMVDVVKSDPVEMAKLPMTGFIFNDFGEMIPEKDADGKPTDVTLKDISSLTKPDFLNRKEEFVDKIQGLLNESYVAKQFIFFNKETFEVQFLLDGVAMLELFGFGFGIDKNFTNIINGGSPILPIIKALKDFELCDDIDPFETESDRAFGNKKGNPNTGNVPDNGEDDGNALTDDEIGDLGTGFQETIIYSTGEFISGIDYTYFYINDFILDLVNEADALAKRAEDEDDSKLARDAYIIYQTALAKDPNSEAVQERIQKLSFEFDLKPHMIMKFILSIIAVPIKIIVKIICTIIEFFENLTLSKLPTDVPKFLKFEWLLEEQEIVGVDMGPIIGPTAMLSYLGVNFDPATLIGWLKDLPTTISEIVEMKGEVTDLVSEKLKAEVDGLDVTEMETELSSLQDQLTEKLTIIYKLTDVVQIPFVEDLPTVTPEEIKVIAKKPLNLIYGLLELLTMIINALLKLVFSIFGMGAILKCPNDNYTEIMGDSFSWNQEDDLPPSVETNRGYLVTDGDEDEDGNYTYYVFYDDGDTDVVDEAGLDDLIVSNPNVRFKLQYR